MKHQKEAVSHDFSTLMSLGRVIAGVSWVGIVVGVLIILAGARNVFSSDFSLTGLGILAVGIITIIVNLVCIAIGQSITCFISIEKYTRATYELLKSKNIHTA